MPSAAIWVRERGGCEAIPQGHVRFAGDHCALSFTRFMKGVARSGERAVAEILADVTGESTVLLVSATARAT